jgi:hypothetical protein
MTDAASGGDAAASPAVGVFAGRAAVDALDLGWFVGHFMARKLDPDDPRATSDLEVKWAVYDGGEARTTWAANRTATTLAVLVRGRFRLRFPDRDVLLAEEGDYVLWRPNVPHAWEAETAAIVLTVRWPSTADDHVEVPDPR